MTNICSNHYTVIFHGSTTQIPFANHDNSSGGHQVSVKLTLILKLIFSFIRTRFSVNFKRHQALTKIFVVIFAASDVHNSLKDVKHSQNLSWLQSLLLFVSQSSLIWRYTYRSTFIPSCYTQRSFTSLFFSNNYRDLSINSRLLLTCFGYFCHGILLFV